MELKTERNHKSKPYEHPYPENLILELWHEVVFEENTFTSLTDDQMAGLDYSISTLKPAERDVLKLRYEDLLTWRKIGDTFGRSAETVRQRAQKAIRKLRHPSKLGYILLGMQGNTEWLERKQLAEKTLLDVPLVETPEALLENFDCVPVEGIGLYCNSFYCLSKEGIKTVGQLYRTIERDPVWGGKLQDLEGKDEIIRLLRRALKKYQ